MVVAMETEPTGSGGAVMEETGSSGVCCWWLKGQQKHLLLWPEVLPMQQHGDTKMQTVTRQFSPPNKLPAPRREKQEVVGVFRSPSVTLCFVSCVEDPGM